MCVNILSKVALDSAAAGIWTRDLQSQVQRPNHCTTERNLGLYVHTGLNVWVVDGWLY